MKLCECGCGKPAPIADRPWRKKGIAKGEPHRFVHGHNRRKPLTYTVDPNTGCWHFRAVKGYGRFDVDGRHLLAHRYFYERAKGSIPEGLHLDHLCRNPRCCNPDHLEPVTAAENSRRGLTAKLTAAEVLAIRASDTTSRTLAARFGVSQHTINDIRARRSWADLDELRIARGVPDQA